MSIFSVPAQALGWLGPWMLVAYVIVHWMRLKPKMRELQDSADGSLRKDLMAQLAAERVRSDDKIERLEKQLIDERADCTRRIEALEEIAFGKGATSSLHPGPE